MKLMKKSFKYIAIFLVFVTITLSVLYLLRSNITQQEKSEYATLIEEGDKALDRKEYGKAITTYSKAAEVIPQNLDAYEKIVDTLSLKGRFDDAKSVVEQSGKVLNASKKSSLYSRLASHYYEAEIYNKAEEFYLDANNLKASDSIELNLAKVYLKLNDISKSKKYLEKVSKDASGSVGLDADLLRAYNAKADVTAAKQFFDKWDLALEDDKTLASKATAYQKALGSVTNDDLYSRAILSREIINAGYPVLAIDLLESEVEKMKDYPDGMYFLARAYYDSGKYSSALDILNKSLGFDTYSGEIYLMVARINIINGDINSAFEAYDKAVVFATEELKGEIYREYIEILISEKSYSQAKSNLDKVINGKLTDTIWPYTLYLEMYYDQKNYDEMASVLSTLAKLSNLTDQEKMEYLRWQIVYSIENDKLASAKELLTTLRSLDRYNPYYYLLSGRINLIEGNNDKAKEELELALNYDLEGSVTESAKKLLGRIE